MNSGSMYTDTAAGVKRCAGHAALPLTAVLDAELTVGLPPTLTAWTGMDALVHALEAIFVRAYHPMCDAIGLRALRMIQEHLGAAHADGGNLAAREGMLVASSLAAVAFQKGLGAVHGLSEPIGAVYDAHHGLTNAVLLPHVLRDLARTSPAALEEPCAEVARALRLPSEGSGTTAVIAWVDELIERLGIPRRLGELISMDGAAKEAMAIKAEANPTGHTNIVLFSAEDYSRILDAAL